MGLKTAQQDACIVTRRTNANPLRTVLLAEPYYRCYYGSANDSSPEASTSPYTTNEAQLVMAKSELLIIKELKLDSAE